MAQLEGTATKQLEHSEEERKELLQMLKQQNEQLKQQNEQFKELMKGR